MKIYKIVIPAQEIEITEEEINEDNSLNALDCALQYLTFTEYEEDVEDVIEEDIENDPEQRSQ